MAYFKRRSIYEPSMILLKGWRLVNRYSFIIMNSTIAATIPLLRVNKKWMYNLPPGQLKNVSNSSIYTKWHILHVSGKYSLKYSCISFFPFDGWNTACRKKINWAVSKNQDRLHWYSLNMFNKRSVEMVDRSTHAVCRWTP